MPFKMHIIFVDVYFMTEKVVVSVHSETRIDSAAPSRTHFHQFQERRDTGTFSNTICFLFQYFSGVLFTTGNITVHPFYPNKGYTVVIQVANAESCSHVSYCTMSLTVEFTNWVIKQNFSSYVPCVNEMYF